MRAPDATTTQTDDKPSKPVVCEETLAQHDRDVIARTSQRVLAYEECCAYCDVHCVERLSSGKKRFIQDWNHDVSKTISQQNQRFNTITQENAKKLKRQAKLKLQNYSPPGSPDIDEGFRVIQTPVSLRSRKSSANSSRSASSVTPQRNVRRPRQQRLTSSTTDTGSSAADNDDVTQSVKNQMAKLSLLDKRYNSRLHHHHQKQLRHTRSETAEDGSAYSEQQSAGASTQLVKNSRTGVVRAHTISGTFESAIRDTSGTRTCSNALLNVYSIDDSLPSYRNKYREAQLRDAQNRVAQQGNTQQRDAQRQQAKPETPTSSERLAPSSKTILRRRSTGSGRTHSAQSRTGILKHSATTQHLTPGVASPVTDVNANEKSSQKHSEASLYADAQQVNGAVVAAFSSLEKSNEVTHNKACTGLYVSGNQRLKPSDRKSRDGSKRFRQLNRVLRHKMGEQYTHGSELAYRLRQHNVHRRPSTSATCITDPVPSPQQDSQHDKRGVTFSEAPASAVTPTMNSPEHFLEMLMELDQSGASNAGQLGSGNAGQLGSGNAGQLGSGNSLNLHTFVYV